MFDGRHVGPLRRRTRPATHEAHEGHAKLPSLHLASSPNGDSGWLNLAGTLFASGKFVPRVPMSIVCCRLAGTEQARDRERGPRVGRPQPMGPKTVAVPPRDKLVATAFRPCYKCKRRVTLRTKSIPFAVSGVAERGMIVGQCFGYS